jgi:hypothetical protein
LIFSLIPQLSHSVYAYLNLAKLQDSIWSLFYHGTIGLLFALGVSLTILIQTLRGNIRTAYLYLGIELLINLIYYGVMNTSDWVSLSIQVLFAIITPYTISTYSSLINDMNKEEEKEIKNNLAILTNIQNEKDNLTALSNELMQKWEDKIDVISKNNSYMLEVEGKQYNVNLKPNYDDETNNEINQRSRIKESIKSPINE